jgi:hypothetical protein
MFCIAHDSAMITSFVSKWQYLQPRKQRKVEWGQVRQMGWVVDDENSLVKNSAFFYANYLPTVAVFLMNPIGLDP